MTALKPDRRSISTALKNRLPAAAWPSIYRATDTRDNRQVALKIPHPDMEADPILFDRFQREAGIGEKLDHPKVMRVYRRRGALAHLHGDGMVPRPPAAPDSGRRSAAAGARHAHRREVLEAWITFTPTAWCIAT